MSTRLFTATLAICACTALQSVAQSIPIGQQMLPEVQYHNAVPVGVTPAAANSQSRLIEQIKYFSPAGAAELRIDSVHFSYSGAQTWAADGSPMFKERLYQNAQASDRSRRSFQSYNRDNSLALATQQRWDTAAAAWADQSRHSLSYQKGALAHDTAWQWSAKESRWLPASFAHYFHDGAGRTERILGLRWNAAKSTLDSTADLRYRFNAAGNVAECISMFGSGHLKPVSREYFSYNDADALTGFYHQRWDSFSASWVNEYGYEFSLGDRNQRLQQLNLNWNAASAAWESLARYSYTYGADGNPATMTYEVRIAENKWQNVDRSEYTYNASGQLTTALRKAWGRSVTDQTESWSLVGSDKILFRYELQANGVAAQLQADRNLRIWPVPASRQLNMDVRNLSGQYRVSISDMQGRVLKSWVRVAGGSEAERFDLDGVPSGNYSILLQSGDGRAYSSRFSVVQ